ncbi:MAG: hypothetical protein H7339_20305 [Arcicella sp.]|nr:hypothetical protein [Arcicella sp.]
MEYNPNRQSENKLKIAVAVLGLLALALGFLYFRERQNNSEVEEISTLKAKELLSANTKLDSIENQLNSKIIEIKKLGGNVDELIRAKTQLQVDKVALQKMEGFSVKKYNIKIKDYLALLGQKDAQLITLRKENGILSAKNDSLSKETKNLLEGISFAQKALSDSATNYTLKQKELSDRAKEVEARNRELNEKVSQAAALRAESINIYAISTKGREIDGSSVKSKRIDKVRITFYLQENQVTTREAKTIYLRILDPLGAAVADMATGSGTFSYKGKETTYTARQKISFDNSHQSVEFVYSRGLPYREGKHIIELYAEGYRIGEGVFEVK